MTRRADDRQLSSWIWRGLVLSVIATLTLSAVAVPAQAKKDRGRPQAGSAAGLPVTAGSMYSVVDQIGARALWERGITGAGVNVAVVDTGVADVGPLRGAKKVVAMVDLSAEAHVPEARYADTYGHGTHMSGIIAGRDKGADPATAHEHPEWFLGVAPDAGLVSVKVGDNDGDVDVSQVIAGIDWVTEHADELDIGVLNLSFSSDSLNSYLTDPLTYAVERAWRAGIVVVVAAGNDGLGEPRLGVPANDPYVIAVGGLGATGDGRFTVPSWATNGNGVRNPDVGAPGVSIESLRSPGSRVDLEHPEARVGDHLFKGSGSSQAAAVTSGAVALLLQAKPWATPDQVKAMLTRSADPSVLPIDGALYAGHGALRVDRALRASTFLATQLHPPALGTGSIEASRGSVHLTLGDTVVSGETTVLGDAWNGAGWGGSRWSEGVWDGSRWSGASWLGSRWSHATWAGSRWSGASWTGVEWAGSRWSDAAWSGASWTGSRWSGSRWSESSWTGSRWSGSRWSNGGWE